MAVRTVLSVETRAVGTLRLWLNKGCGDIWAVVKFGPRSVVTIGPR